MEQKQVNCKVDCVNGCILGESCPNTEYREAVSKFIQDTPLDQMLEIAEAARMKKMMEPPKWVLPDDI
ncbi:MAG: hypothetical protein HC903_18015 [Methylacidiphilales bacterium]|nr:hypothetical protein [Candidatus Methylacidiphilales bacterium]NJR17847.1 hypothetical protein [Calothrix sp. CSU_2_0]